MIYRGIDPGKKGGIAYIDEYKAATLPFSAEGLIDTMISLDMASSPKICCLEEVHALPRQGVASTFTFGEGYGHIKGVLETIGIPYQTVSPRRWKKEFGLCSDKKKSIEVCKRLFPKTSLRASDRSRTESDGMAEALLMAEYARRKL